MTRISLSQRCRVPASFLSPCTPKRKSRSKGETHLFQGSAQEAEGRGACRLPPLTACMYPHPALCCFSCPVFSPDTLCSCQTWLRGGQESSSWITCTANPKAAGYYPFATQLQPLPLIHFVLLMSLLSVCRETAGLHESKLQFRLLGAMA